MRPSEACHYLGHRNAMKTELTVSENLRFWKDFLGDFPGGRGMAIDEAAEIVGLAGITHLPFGYLSMRPAAAVCHGEAFDCLATGVDS